MIKTERICDLCGQKYRSIKNWTLDYDIHVPSVFTPIKRVKMDICDQCANWIKSQRGKGRR